jgi:hypothetical protein
MRDRSWMVSRWWPTSMLTLSKIIKFCSNYPLVKLYFKICYHPLLKYTFFSQIIKMTYQSCLYHCSSKRIVKYFQNFKGFMYDSDILLPSLLKFEVKRKLPLFSILKPFISEKKSQ